MSKQTRTPMTGEDALGTMFVGLKLCGVIDWSWWWVLSPFWGYYAIAGVIAFFEALFGGKKKS